MAKKETVKDKILKENRRLRKELNKRKISEEIQEERMRILREENRELSERVIAAEQKIKNGRIVWIGK